MHSCLIGKQGQSCPWSRAILHVLTMWLDMMFNRQLPRLMTQALSLPACIVGMPHLNDGVTEPHTSQEP